MSKKPKLLTALAIGAIALIIGSSVARCSLSMASDGAAEEQAAAEASAAVESAPAEQESTFQELSGTTWSKDGGQTLSLSDNTIVISDADGERIFYYTVDEESRSGSDVNVTLSLSKKMNGEQSTAVVAIQPGEDGGQTLTCDQLGGTFARDAEGDTSIELVGSSEELLSLFGCEKRDFESALTEYAKAKSPHATKATWDKEAWIDYAAETMVANFTLDDATGTFVSVVKDASGRLVAQ